MLKLLDRLGLKPAPDLPILLQEALDTHNHRQEKLPISRTSLFYACLKRSSEILGTARASGFSMRAYEKSIGMMFPPPISVIAAEPEDVDINPETREALSRHAERWRHRPVDAVWIAAAILNGANFVFLQHLERAGLTPDGVKAAAERLASIIVPPASPHAFADAPWEADAIKRYAALDQFALSPSVRDLFGRALRATRQLPVRSPVVTTSLLLIAALTGSAAAGSTFEWLQRRARSRVTPDEFDLRMREWLGWYRRPMPFPVGPEEAFLTDAVLALLGEAERVATATDGKSIDERHFVVALLSLPQETGVHRFLSFINSSVESLRRDLLGWITEGRTLRPERSRWLAILGSPGAGVASPDDGTIAAPAEYIDDQRRLDDQLGFRRDVNAFAALICAKDVQPPLSIGIFGDWGSGKSFFMDMMYDAIRRNAQLADDGKAEQFLPRVLQIRFNAWHYTEANLWASLVEHIFGHIFEYLHPGNPADKKIRVQRDQLMQTIDAMTAEKMRLQRETDAAKIARDHAAKEVDAERARSESTAAMVRRLVSTSAWESPAVNDDDAKKDLHTALAKAGVDRVIETASDLRTTVSDLASVGSRVRIFWSWLLTGPYAVLRMLLLAAVLALPLIARELAGGEYPRLRELSTKVSTYFLLVTTWLTPVLMFARRVMTQLDLARKKVETVFAKAEAERLEALEAARKKQEDAERKLENAASALKTAEQNLNEAQTKLADLGDERRLARFVQERAASDDYRKLLGVIATVRKDFENLMKLMNLRGKDASLRVDRIVLYVDDLDRCPPERVEQVLQAVHLLLAFKLFVVVVGVDARWVTRSLRIRHPMLAEKTAAGERGLPGFGARPEDYLEKIFQIPFWIQRMNEQSTASLVNSLLDPPPPVDELPPASPIDHRVDTTEETDLSSDLKIEPSPAMVDTTPSAAVAPPIDPVTTEEPTRVDPAAITPHERAYLHVVAPLASRSPRAIKRFVNVYRLIRSSIPAAKIERFIDEQNGDFYAVLVLLATVIGVPSVAVEFLRHIERLDGATTLEELSATIRPLNDESSAATDEWHRLQCHLNDIAAVSRSMTVGDLRRQISRVGRYTFEYGRF